MAEKEQLRFTSSEIVRMKESISNDIQDEDTKHNLLRLINGTVYFQEVAKDMQQKNEMKLFELQETLSNYERVIHSEKVKRHALEDQLKTFLQENLRKFQSNYVQKPVSMENPRPAVNQVVHPPPSKSEMQTYHDSIIRTDVFAERN